MSERSFNYRNIITCKIDRNNWHMLKSPKILPCGNSACLSCIQKELNRTGRFACNFDSCKSIHQISDPIKLIDNIMFEEVLKDNMWILIDEFCTKIKRQFNVVKGIFLLLFY